MSSALEIPRKVWTREEAHALMDLGFPNASRLELIDGELIDHMGKKRPHVLWEILIRTWLISTFGEEFVQTESPIDVSAEDNIKSEPEPDLIVTLKSVREYNVNPTAEELRLVIEVSDSTVNYDLQKKAPIYARAGIADYWVIDIPNNLVHVHRKPVRSAYTSIIKYGFHNEIRPLAKPDAMLCMERL